MTITFFYVLMSLVPSLCACVCVYKTKYKYRLHLLYVIIQTLVKVSPPLKLNCIIAQHLCFRLTGCYFSLMRMRDHTS